MGALSIRLQLTAVVAIRTFNNSRVLPSTHTERPVAVLKPTSLSPTLRQIDLRLVGFLLREKQEQPIPRSRHGWTPWDRKMVYRQYRLCFARLKVVVHNGRPVAEVQGIGDALFGSAGNGTSPETSGFEICVVEGRAVKGFEGRNTAMLG